MALDNLRQSEPGAPGTSDKNYWPGLEKLSSVQDLLDQNKLLIAEINQNHEIKTPEALQRNAILIKQLNTNIGKVLGLYGELASLVDRPREATLGERS